MAVEVAFGRLGARLVRSLVGRISSDAIAEQMSGVASHLAGGNLAGRELSAATEGLISRFQQEAGAAYIQRPGFMVFERIPIGADGKLGKAETLTAQELESHLKQTYGSANKVPQVVRDYFSTLEKIADHGKITKVEEAPVASTGASANSSRAFDTGAGVRPAERVAPDAATPVAAAPEPLPGWWNARDMNRQGTHSDPFPLREGPDRFRRPAATGTDVVVPPENLPAARPNIHDVVGVNPDGSLHPDSLLARLQRVGLGRPAEPSGTSVVPTTGNSVARTGYDGPNPPPLPAGAGQPGFRLPHFMRPHPTRTQAALLTAAAIGAAYHYGPALMSGGDRPEESADGATPPGATNRPRPVQKVEVPGSAYQQYVQNHGRISQSKFDAASAEAAKLLEKAGIIQPGQQLTEAQQYAANTAGSARMAYMAALEKHGVEGNMASVAQKLKGPKAEREAFLDEHPGLGDSLKAIAQNTGTKMHAGRNLDDPKWDRIASVVGNMHVAAKFDNDRDASAKTLMAGAAARIPMQDVPPATAEAGAGPRAEAAPAGRSPPPPAPPR